MRVTNIYKYFSEKISGQKFYSIGEAKRFLQDEFDYLPEGKTKQLLRILFKPFRCSICQREYVDAVEKEFIENWGVCFLCDEITNEDFINSFENNNYEEK